jgi:hypothetical protein
MRHQDLTLNHRLESYVYANAAARTGASGFVTGDIGRIAYQSDTGEYFRLTATTPTWAQVTILTNDSVTPGSDKFYGTNAAGAKGFIARNLAALAFYLTPSGATSSAVGVMMGMGATVTITPTRSGIVAVWFSTDVTSAVVGAGPQIQARFGTGTAPANGAAVTGSVAGGVATCVIAIAGGYLRLAQSYLLTGLTLGTPYWFDVSLKNFATAGSVTMQNGSWLLLEL